MPKCKICGNTHSFASSKIMPAAPLANGPVSGMIGDFDQESHIISISSAGANKADINAASRWPQGYFDTCLQCGSREIEWSVQ
jgi:hypothetical protein